MPRVILVQVHSYYYTIGIKFNSKQVLVFLEVQAGKYSNINSILVCYYPLVLIYYCNIQNDRNRLKDKHKQSKII